MANNLLLALTIIVALIFSYNGINQNLPQFIIKPDVEKYLKYRYDNNPRLKECRDVANPSKACLYGNPELPSVVLWGDSHVDQIIMPLAEEFEKYGYSTIEFAIPGCPPILNVTRASKGQKCSRRSELILDFLTNNIEIKHVFLHSYWIGYIDEHLIIPQKRTNRLSEIEYIEESFRTVVKSLIKSGKKVHIIYPVPKMKVNPPLFLARRELLYPGDIHPVIKIKSEEFQIQSARATKILDRIVKEFDVNAIHIAQCLFDKESSSYYANDHKSVFYRDNNHLSQTGAYKISKAIALKALGPLNEFHE